jgi:hypothetical protein
MDEAGYGPNLGPLVITATAWDVADDPRCCDFWRLLAGVVSQNPAAAAECLHVADSKRVFSPSRGLAPLETPVLCVLAWSGVDTCSFHTLWRQLAAGYPAAEEQEPWYCEDFNLPVAADSDVVGRLTDRLARCAGTNGVGPPSMQSDVVLTRKFNHLTARHNSKGHVLSSLSLALLARLWNPSEATPTLIVADKHGGRNRYDQLLAEVLDGEMIFRVHEGRERSTYRVGRAEIRFQTRAETHFPVAVASMVSKYLRELAMLAFNRFWQSHVPRLKPTQGYPRDSHRFRADIAACQALLQIPDQILWRER